MRIYISTLDAVCQNHYNNNYRHQYIRMYNILGLLFVCIAIITYIQRICNYANTRYIRYVHMCNTIITLQEI